MRHFFSLSFLISILLFAAGHISAQIAGSMNEATSTRWGGNNNIVGTVFFPNGQRVNVRMPIRLRSAVKGDVIATTDDMGRFIFSGLSEGFYSVTIDGERDYEAISAQVEVIRNRNPTPESYFVNLRLVDKKSNLVPKPAVIEAAEAGIPKSAKESYDKALELSAKKDHKGAIAQLESAIAMYPNFTNAYNELAVQYQKLGELEKADEALVAALKIDPNAFEPMMNRGIVLFRLNRNAEAEELLRKITVGPEPRPLAHFYLGRTLVKLGRAADAEQEFLKALEKGSEIEMKEAHRMLASIYIEKDDRPKAAASLERYIGLAPNAPDIDRLKAALAEIKRAIGKP